MRQTSIISSTMNVPGRGRLPFFAIALVVQKHTIEERYERGSTNYSNCANVQILVQNLIKY